MTALTLTRRFAARKPAGLLAWLIAADAGFRQRKALRSLSDTHLADMGLSRDQAEAL